MGKTLLSVFIVLLFTSFTICRAQSFTWGITTKGNGNNFPRGIALDQAGNIYVMGYYISPEQ